jgi:ACS family D-galactonate transporter-like MFS transporter
VESQIASSELKPKLLHWAALLLLVISVCINYADRGNLGVAAKSLERELFLSQRELGILLGSFSLTYAFSQLLAGKLVERWNVNWLLALAFFLWSAATAATGLASSFSSILILRLALGIGESVAYPAYAKMIVITFPEKLRGTANGLIDAGSKLGPALGFFLGVKMIEWFSWRGMFLVIGGASLLWLAPWCAIAGRLPGKRSAKGVEADWTPSYLDLMKRRQLWGTALGLFGGNYAWFFLLNWLPYYFENERHYTRDRLAVFGSLPFVAVAISAMVFGLAADALISRGRNAGRVRQYFCCTGMLGCGALMLPSVVVRSEQLGNVLLIGALIFLGVWSGNHWAFTQLLSGQNAAGKWTGLQNCIGNFAGVLGPVVSGFALQATHSFFSAFAIACVVLLIGVLGYSMLIRTPAELDWSAHRTVTSEHQLT